MWLTRPKLQPSHPSLGIPTVRDRIVQAAVVNVIEPIFEKDFAEHSYGFRPGRGCKDALRRVDQLLKAGDVHVVDADLKGDFDSIPHNGLMKRLQEKIADGSVLSLIEAFLKAGIVEEAATWTPESGAPQGAVLSPLLSNLYLDPLDHLVAIAGFKMVRYADDFVILCRTSEEAQRALDLVRQWVSDNGLVLHPTKTRIVDSRSESFEFLGYEFHGEKHWPRKKSLAKLKATLRQQTRRNSGGLAVVDHRDGESGAAGLVRLLPAQQPSLDLQRPRQLAPHASAQLAAQTHRRSRGRPRTVRQLRLAQPLLRRTRAVQSRHSPSCGPSILTKVNHQLESRMRETRPSGSEGGGTEPNRSFLPLSSPTASS